MLNNVYLYIFNMLYVICCIVNQISFNKYTKNILSHT